MKILVVLEHDHQQLRPASLAAIGFANAVAGQLDKLLPSTVGCDHSNRLLHGKINGIDVAVRIACGPFNSLGKLARRGQRLGLEQFLSGNR